MTTVEDIIETVAELHNLGIKDITGSSHRQIVTYARQIAIFIIREYFPKITLRDIGKYFGKRDHSTIIYSLRTIKGLLGSRDIKASRIVYRDIMAVHIALNKKELCLSYQFDNLKPGEPLIYSGYTITTTF